MKMPPKIKAASWGADAASETTVTSANNSLASINSQYLEGTEAVSFLSQNFAHLDGFISVAAIDHDGSIKVASAPTTGLLALDNFIKLYNGKRNLYFSVNPLKFSLSKKAGKSDVKELAFLHVDIDPREGYAFAEERERIRSLVEKFPIPPNIIVDSGGGFQCFWRISPSVAVEDNISELEAYNKRLANALGGDHCWSIDHLMRLPNTLNIPNEDKQKKGQSTSLASVIHQDAGAYNLKDFDSLPPANQTSGGEIVLVTPSVIPEKFYELLDMDPKLKARWEGNSSGLNDTSRSGMDMSLAQLLWSHDLTKSEIAAILLQYPYGKGKDAGKQYISHTLSKLVMPSGIDEQELTDLGNAHRLVAGHWEDIRFCHSRKKWLIWDGEYWRWDEDGQVMRYAKETIRAMQKAASKLQDDEKRRMHTKWALKSQDARRLQAMVELAKTEPNIPVSLEQLDRIKHLFGVSNGVIDLRSGHLLQFDRMHYITKSAEIDFDPNAKCPVWLDFLHQTFGGNQEIIDYVQRAAGYSLTGDTSEECMFLLHGEGANGKSTFLNTILALTGGYGMQCAPETLMSKREGGISNDIARLNGARFVATSETDAGQRFAESLIKQLTGRDRVVARHLYSEHFEFEPEFKIWLAANHKPAIQGTDYAIWRRIKLIPFKVTIPKEKQDKHLIHKLQNELPGIFNWALEGCLAWHKEGLNEPDEVLHATQGYKDEMDTLGNWLQEECTTGTDKEGKASELYDSYKNWCSGIGEKPLSNPHFSQAIQSKGFQKKATKKGNVYVGVDLKAYL